MNEYENMTREELITLIQQLQGHNEQLQSAVSAWVDAGEIVNDIEADAELLKQNRRKIEYQRKIAGLIHDNRVMRSKLAGYDKDVAEFYATAVNTAADQKARTEWAKDLIKQALDYGVPNPVTQYAFEIVEGLQTAIQGDYAAGYALVEAAPVARINYDRLALVEIGALHHFTGVTVAAGLVLGYVYEQSEDPRLICYAISRKLDEWAKPIYPENQKRLETEIAALVKKLSDGWIKDNLSRGNWKPAKSTLPEALMFAANEDRMRGRKNWAHLSTDMASKYHTILNKLREHGERTPDKIKPIWDKTKFV